MSRRAARRGAWLLSALSWMPAAGCVTAPPPDQVALPGHPFQAVPVGADTLLVSLGGADGGTTGIAALRRAGAGFARVAVVALGGPARGLSVSPDGQTLAVARGDATLLLPLDRVLSGQAGPPSLRIDGQSGAIETAFSPDGRWLAVSEETAGRVMLVDLRPGGRPVELEAGRAPVGLGFSPDGRWLYATSETARRPGGACPASGRDARVSPGLVFSIRLDRGTPFVAATAEVGCAPVRIVLSADGATAFVSLRAEDRVAAFDTASLRAGSGRRRASVAVGTAPVGMALSADGRSLVVADSDRFEPGADGAVSCVAVSDRSLAEAWRVPGGGFPRNVTALPDGRDAVALFNDDALRIVPGACAAPASGPSPRPGS